MNLELDINIMLYYRHDERGSEGGGAMDEKREVRYALRLPPDLHAALVELARREDRSLTQQLIYLLRQAVRRDAQRQKRAQAE